MGEDEQYSSEVDEWGTHFSKYLCVDDDTVEKEAPKTLENFLSLIGGWDETNVAEKETWSIG